LKRERRKKERKVSGGREPNNLKHLPQISALITLEP
jgi:hypothetical protein